MASRLTAEARQHERLALELFDEVVDLEPPAVERRLGNAPPAVAHRVREMLIADVRAHAMDFDGAVVRLVARAQATPPPKPVIAGFEVGEVLGSGGMGTVYEAAQRHPRRAVAIKVLHPELTARWGDAFRDEANALARLQHPSIPQIWEAGTTERGHAYQAMELVHGERLGDWASTVSQDRVRDVLIEVCDAVACAHAGGVLHRDLKPGNILVGLDDRPWLIDFGLADVGEGTSEGGTRGFMAPELEAGGRSTPASEVYALGRVAAQVLRGDVDLDAIVGKATAASPADRYPTVEELGKDLVRHRSREPVGARRRSALARLALAAVRHRRRVLGSALAVAGVGLVVAGTVAYQGWARELRELGQRDALAVEAVERARLEGTRHAWGRAAGAARGTAHESTALLGLAEALQGDGLFLEALAVGEALGGAEDAVWPSAVAMGVAPDGVNDEMAPLLRALSTGRPLAREGTVVRRSGGEGPLVWHADSAHEVLAADPSLVTLRGLPGESVSPGTLVGPNLLARPVGGDKAQLVDLSTGVEVAEIDGVRFDTVAALWDGELYWGHRGDAYRAPLDGGRPPRADPELARIGSTVTQMITADLDRDGEEELCFALGPPFGHELRCRTLHGETHAILLGTPRELGVVEWQGERTLVAVLSTGKNRAFVRGLVEGEMRRLDLIGLDSGGLGRRLSATSPIPGAALGSVHAGDFDGDGLDDLAVHLEGRGERTWLIPPAPGWGLCRRRVGRWHSPRRRRCRRRWRR